MASLPRLWSGERRYLLTALVLTGCGQAAAAAAVAGLLSVGVAHPAPTVRLMSVGGLVGVAVSLGWLRYQERVLSERLGQRYVHQVRRRLLARGLSPGHQPALGVAVARNTNDLASVRNWVSFGVAPLAAAVPLALGATVVLAVLHPLLAAALLLPLVALGAAFWLLSGPAYRRSRRLRRARGRLAAQLADTLVAAPGIRAAGGRSRELRRLLRHSTSVVERAVERAVAAGRIRGAAAGAGGLALAAIAAVSLAARLDLATLAAAVSVVGLVVTPMQDLGRVVEYRQSYRAARRILLAFLEHPAGSNRPAAPYSTGRVEAIPAAGPVEAAAVVGEPDQGRQEAAHMTEQDQGRREADHATGEARPRQEVAHVAGQARVRPGAARVRGPGRPQDRTAGSGDVRIKGLVISTDVEASAGAGTAAGTMAGEAARTAGAEPLPDLEVGAGARVLLTGSSCERVGLVLATLAGAEAPAAGGLVVDDVVLPDAGDRARRTVVGFVARAMPLERGTVLRAVRYRHPKGTMGEVDDVLSRVGLRDRLAELPDGLRTRLKHGGSPLTREERTLLLLARATFGDPALLLLDHVEADLGPRGREVLRAVLDVFPGVVLAAAHDPEHLRPTHFWAVG